jgi:hypothetical protein
MLWRKNWGKFQTPIELTEDWKEYKLWFDQFVPTPYSALETKAPHGRTQYSCQESSICQWQSYGESVVITLEIYLDDIRSMADRC